MTYPNLPYVPMDDWISMTTAFRCIIGDRMDYRVGLGRRPAARADKNE